MKFAVAVSAEVKEDLRFLETVTRNRGMQVQMFDSTDAALKWLLPKSNMTTDRASRD